MEREAEEKAEKYIENLKTAFETLKVNERYRHLADLAKTYMLDAEYYLSRGEYITSIACSSYAEGLLDALKKIGVADFEWPHRVSRPKRVLVGGVFDILHPGHIYFLKEASKIGRVIVVVARDETVRKLKGREPIIPESQRLEVVKAVRYVSEAYLGEPGLDVEKTIAKIKPDIVVLGPDQCALEEELKHLGIKYVKVKTRKETCPLPSTTAIIKKIIGIFCHKEETASQNKPPRNIYPTT